MIEPATTYPRVSRSISQRVRAPCSRDSGWFGTRDGRRYGWELVSIVAIKMLLLALLWLIFIAPYSKSETPAATVVQRLYLPVPPLERRD